MKRGEIYFAVLDPTVGSEINKKRPVIIVSNNASNRAASLVTIVPLTSNIKRFFSFDVLLNPEDSGLKMASKAQCDQVRTISKQRIRGKSVGMISRKLMFSIEAGLRLHLAL